MGRRVSSDWDVFNLRAAGQNILNMVTTLTQIHTFSSKIEQIIINHFHYFCLNEKNEEYYGILHRIIQENIYFPLHRFVKTSIMDEFRIGPKAQKKI